MNIKYVHCDEIRNNGSDGRSGGHSEKWLASLRGLAVLLVFVSHLPLYKACYDIGFILGCVGVVCFFLMTGYLALSARKRRTGKRYLLNRFFRMYPVFWLLLLLTYLEWGTTAIPLKA